MKMWEFGVSLSVPVNATVASVFVVLFVGDPCHSGLRRS
jgi:hypothetical protein